ncbi:hypothetical protein SGLAM104S_02316 [Streptomyces glaucescens]
MVDHQVDGGALPLQSVLDERHPGALVEVHQRRSARHQPEGFYGMRERALGKAATPAMGGDETAYLEAFLDIRRDAMRAKKATADTSRVDTAQRRWLNAGNLGLNTPLEWAMYGETYKVP